jgi:hypothetical protein
MNITANQMMRVLFLLSWALHEAQGRALSYNGTNATESASPSQQLANPAHEQKLSAGVLFVLWLLFLCVSAGVATLIGIGCNFLCTPNPVRREISPPLTHAYDNLSEGAMPRITNSTVLQDVELQAIPSLANTPGINATLKKHIELIEKSKFRVSELSDEQAASLAEAHPEFCCTLTDTLMDIPVLLDNKRYDFKTLLAHQEKVNTQDPFTRIEFGPSEIIRDDQTRSKMVEALMPLLAQVGEEKSSLLTNAM